MLLRNSQAKRHIKKALLSFLANLLNKEKPHTSNCYQKLHIYYKMTKQIWACFISVILHTGVWYGKIAYTFATFITQEIEHFKV